MKVFDRIVQPLLLLLLLVIGVGLIWHIGHNLPADRSQSSAFVPAPSVPATVPKPAVTAAPPSNSPPQGGTSPAITVQGKLPRLVTTERGQFIATDPILFNSGASTLREASIPKLDKVAELLKKKPEIELEIVGHTDNLGIEPVNRIVSAERAAIVMDYLISQGIDRSRLRSRGMGSVDPITSNDTQLGRQANRRIEFLIIAPGATRKSPQ